MKRLVKTSIMEGELIPSGYEIIQVINQEPAGIENHRAKYKLNVWVVEEVN